MEGMLYPMLVMGGLGVVFGGLLAFASEKFKVEVDPRQSEIRAKLPGANCGGCGFPGCDGYADACVNAGAKPNLCAAAGPEVAAEIAAILGVAAEEAEPMVAYVKCQGTTQKTVKDCVYMGVHDCREAAVVPGKGPSACTFGCMGFGTCVSVCAFGAVKIADGVAKVDPEKCVACGACVNECPRSVITLVPRKSKVQVACSNPLKGPLVKQVCSVGCIGCGICAKVCPVKAATLNGALAQIDPATCINCGLCATKCPVKAITDSRPPRVLPPMPPVNAAEEKSSQPVSA
ncbi:MAG: RnfABCDGE type electron transport complex subunit B [Cloacibacillus sp.]